jgi:hypothetical protein
MIWSASKSRAIFAAAGPRWIGAIVLTAMATGAALAQDTVQITVQANKTRQVYDGVGAGAIFYEGHITSALSFAS